jgi:hypothetical protein
MKKVPELLKGCVWNKQIYGKTENYSVYLNGTKKSITNEQAHKIEEYLQNKTEYQRKVSDIFTKK